MRRLVWWGLMCWGGAALGQEARPEARPEPAAVAVVRAPLAPRPGEGVDWRRQVLRVVGAGAPDMRASNPAQARLGAERSARAEAGRRLLELAQALPLRAERSVGEELAAEAVRARVEKVVGSFRVVRKRYYSDSGVELEAELPLAELAVALVAPNSPVPPREESSGRYTGLVVDARGLGVRPVLAPRLVDAAGKVLHSAELLTGEARQRTGVAGWFESLEEARASALAGERPLVLKAVQLQGSDLVIDEAEAKRLAQERPLLTEGRVAIATQ